MVKQPLDNLAPPSMSGTVASPGVDPRPGEAAHTGFMQLGSWRLNLYASRPFYLETLGSLFRQPIGERPLGAPSEVDAEVYLLSRAYEAPDFSAGRTGRGGRVATWETPRAGVRELFTGKFRVLLEEDRSPMRISILVVEPQYSPRELRDGLFLVLNKLLFELSCFYVHAGAVEFGGRVNVFVGQGSFGKTTTCLRLAREGATILSEDHILFKRSTAGFVLSGCQETARVTPKTARYLFGDALAPADVQDDGKREFAVERFFRSAPYRDVPFHRIFFNHIGDAFRLEPISHQEAVLRLFGMTRTFRAGTPADLDAYLEYFSSLVEPRELFDLELSSDLGRLDELVEFLRA